MLEFVASLVEISALADQSPGFAWRLQTEDGDATAQPFDSDGHPLPREGATRGDACPAT
jgi:hypothetical protein